MKFINFDLNCKEKNNYINKINLLHNIVQIFL